MWRMQVSPFLWLACAVQVGPTPEAVGSTAAFQASSGPGSSQQHSRMAHTQQHTLLQEGAAQHQVWKGDEQSYWTGGKIIFWGGILAAW